MARIIVVADTFDVLTIGRSYRAPLTISQAGEQLSLSGGHQFDPAVVDALASVGLSMLRPEVASTSSDRAAIQARSQTHAASKREAKA